MKKIVIFVSLIMVLNLFFCSCTHQPSYDFLNSSNTITSVSIVKVTFDNNGEIVQTELKIIDNIDNFLEDFCQIDCRTYFGDPIGVTEEGVEDYVIKIAYDNDEYELINYKGQSNYTSQKGFCYYA